MIQFNSVAALALVAVTMCWSLAVVLYRVGTAGSVANRHDATVRKQDRHSSTDRNCDSVINVGFLRAHPLRSRTALPAPLRGIRLRAHCVDTGLA